MFNFFSFRMTLFLIKHEKGKKKKDWQDMLSVELYLRFHIKSLVVIATNIELILYTFFSGVFVMSQVG